MASRSNQKRWIISLTLFSAVVLLNSCANLVDDKSDTELSNLGVMEELTPGTIEDDFARVEALLPGFGGLFYDDNGILNVYLKGNHTEIAAQNNSTANVEAAVASVFGYDRLFNNQAVPETVQSLSADITVLQGEYDFSTLRKWRNAISEKMNMPIAVSIDLDESINRIVVGVESLDATDDIKSMITQQGVPLAAVVFEKDSIDISDVSLTDKSSPVRIRGGFKITSSLGGGCSIGFSATRNGVKGFVTANHCTESASTRGGVQGTRFYQPTSGLGTIGIERVDPPFQQTGALCPSGSYCRASDAAFIEYTGRDTYRRGLVARTSSRSRSSGSTNVVGSFKVVHARKPLMGETVNKIGYKTGWTYGTVKDTCKLSYRGYGKYYTCQTRADYGRGGGDSGGLVFASANGNFDDGIVIYGIHSGYSSDTNLAVFSPYDRVLSALTPLGVNY